MTIESFRGEYAFLSNFHPCSLWVDGVHVTSVEVAYQALKTTDMQDRVAILNCDSAGQSKKMGRLVDVRPGWDDGLKYYVMYDLVRQKFYSDFGLAAMLVNTGEETLKEGNTWGDTYWGVCNGVGENKLGIILMRVRDEIRQFVLEMQERCKDARL